MTQTNLEDSHFNRARASLRQAISWYSHVRRQRPASGDTQRQAALQTQLEQLTTTLDKLDQNVIRIAAFGLVSRGKSAVLNALIGQKILQTGPLHGVTQWPRSIRWTPNAEAKAILELIDTPGLDEVNGQIRSDMAKEVARQADLILFVVSGDITRTEYQAFRELRKSQKPIIIVFNKIDLYPDRDREAIFQQLINIQTGSDRVSELNEFLPTSEEIPPTTEADAFADYSIDDIVMVAAEPLPLRVRVEWPDGHVTEELETRSPQVEELQQKILTLLNEQGRSLLALNALIQARDAQVAIAENLMALRAAEAENLIWQFAKYKAVAIALNPIAILDILAGSITDLALIRSLARLYGLPMTGYEASKLWQKILLSAGGLLMSEMGSSLMLGFGKSAAAVSPGIPAYAGAAIAQATLAGYGTYTVGHAAQIYLAQGCTWGPSGSDTIIRDILKQVEPHSILDRLRQELNLST